MRDELETSAPDEPFVLRAVAILRRRAMLAFALFALALVAGVAAAVTLPDLFRASAVVLVERQLPESVVRPSASGELESRLHVIRQEILSRARLTELINRYDLYPDVRHTDMDRAIEQVRRDIEIELTGPEQVSGRTKTVAFNVSFTGARRDTVADVTNAIADFYITDLPASVAVTVGTGGNGGANATVNSTNGTFGTAGTATVFGGLLNANGGAGGQGGSTSDTNAAVGGVAMYSGGAGGASTPVSFSIPLDAPAVASYGASGGGAGSWIITGGGPGGVGGFGGDNKTFLLAGGIRGNGGAGGGGQAPGNNICGGTGGGGGGNGSAIVGGNGGAGIRGGGGGGGAASENGFNSGAGGAGGAGYCSVAVW